MRSFLPVAFSAPLAILALGGCEEREASFPILEEPTAAALRTASEEALVQLEAARETLDPATASPETLESLDRAQESLRKLTEYFVPLLDAHESVYRAYRFYYVERRRVEPELDRVEAILREVAEHRGEEVEPALADVEALLAEARTALETGSTAAPEHLEALARRLSFMLLKGELIVR